MKFFQKIFNKKLTVLIITIIIGIVLISGLIFVSNLKKDVEKTNQNPPSTSATITNQYSYQGKEGKDALTLLKGQTEVEQSSSMLVTSINGRKADDNKREYWAFYINGEASVVGPADYQTKNEDLIEWKIQTY